MRAARIRPNFREQLARIRAQRATKRRRPAEPVAAADAGHDRNAPEELMVLNAAVLSALRHMDADRQRAVALELDPRRLARRSDPATSHAAAEEVAENGTAARQVEMIVAALRSNPGSTSNELGHLGAGFGGRDEAA